MLAPLQTLYTINWICIVPIILSMNYFLNFIFFLLHNISLFQKQKCSITFIQADRVTENRSTSGFWEHFPVTITWKWEF